MPCGRRRGEDSDNEFRDSSSDGRLVAVIVNLKED